MAADFEHITVSIRLFFNWVLCIYIILDKDCHILYVFCLNSTVCSHIVGVHLSSDQVTYDSMMDADLYNSFLLRLRIKSFYQPSVCISLLYYILVQFGMSSYFNFTCIILYLYCYLYSPAAFASYCSIHMCDCVQKNFLEQPYGSNSYSKWVHMLTRGRRFKNRP